MTSTTAPALLVALLLTGPAAEPPPELVSLDLKEAPLLDVLRYFSEVSGFNLVVDPSVDGTVTVRLIDVPWDQALKVILRAHDLGFDAQDNVIYVAPLAELARAAAAEAELRRERMAAVELETLWVRLSYADPDEIAALISKTALTPRGSVAVDRRTGMLIIRDVPERARRAKRTAKSLDR